MDVRVNEHQPRGAVAADVARIADGRLVARPWRRDSSVLQLLLLPGAAVSPDTIKRCVDRVAAEGWTRVITAALAPLEQPPFLASGFAVDEELVLLSMGLDAHPLPRPDAAVRRAHRGEWSMVEHIDKAAFDTFWHLDVPALQAALQATPSSRLRVVEEPVAGYCITGRAADRGYVQRLAVSPTAQGKGFGRALALDGLRWMQRRDVRCAYVNTQMANQTALSLYHSLGFREEPAGLAVLGRDLSGAPA